MKYIVLSDKVSGDIYYYENKNILEEKYLFMAITLVNPIRLVIQTSSVMEISENTRQIKTVPELFSIVSDFAMELVA